MTTRFLLTIMLEFFFYETVLRLIQQIQYVLSIFTILNKCPLNYQSSTLNKNAINYFKCVCLCAKFLSIFTITVIFDDSVWKQQKRVFQINGDEQKIASFFVLFYLFQIICIFVNDYSTFKLSPYQYCTNDPLSEHTLNLR